MSELQENLNIKIKEEENNQILTKENQQNENKFSSSYHIYEEQAPPGPMNNKNNIQINYNGNKQIYNNSQQFIINSNDSNINNKIHSKCINNKNDKPTSSEIGNYKPNI